MSPGDKPAAPESKPESLREDAGRDFIQDTSWEDFRDHIATAEKDGSRRWLYPRKPSGKWHKRRAWLAFGLIVLMFAGPWIRIQGNPLLMFNIPERKFSILGQIFWPQDMFLFAIAMLIFITGIIIFTTAFGRLWCGWTCPQTVMMEMVFRKIEYWIEGDASQQRALNQAPWTAGKAGRKALKHGLFLLLSFMVGNTLLAYIIGSDALLAIQLDDPRNHLGGLTAMVLFTLLFYSIFARFREQACTFICPYGRFQSAILDENTLVVAYDHKRGEKRGPVHRGEEAEARRARGAGDCVNCRHCVAVCPTGIDIRNGVQMECVNCTACIDACDHIMDRAGFARGLIRFASLNNIEKGEPQRFTPRMRLYAGLLAGLVALFIGLLMARSDVDAVLLRAPGGLFTMAANGDVQNLYILRLTNKTPKPASVTLELDSAPGTVQVMGGRSLEAPPSQRFETSVLIQLPPDITRPSSFPLKLRLVCNGRTAQKLKTTFAGPRQPGSPTQNL